MSYMFGNKKFMFFKLNLLYINIILLNMWVVCFINDNNVYNMSYMFSYYSSLTSFSLYNINSKNIKNMN